MTATLIRHHDTGSHVGIVVTHTNLAGQFRATFQLYRKSSAPDTLRYLEGCEFSDEWQALCRFNNWRTINRTLGIDEGAES